MYEIIFHNGDEGFGHYMEITLDAKLRVTGHHPAWIGKSLHWMLTEQYPAADGWDFSGYDADKVWDKYLRQVRDRLNKSEHLAAIVAAGKALGM